MRALAGVTAALCSPLLAQAQIAPLRNRDAGFSPPDSASWPCRVIAELVWLMAERLAELFGWQSIWKVLEDVHMQVLTREKETRISHALFTSLHAHKSLPRLAASATRAFKYLQDGSAENLCFRAEQPTLWLNRCPYKYPAHLPACPDSTFYSQNQQTWSQAESLRQIQSSSTQFWWAGVSDLPWPLHRSLSTSSTDVINLLLIPSSSSLMKTLKKTGPNPDPCGMPLDKHLLEEFPSTTYVWRTVVLRCA